jgi:hypothetical protein
MPEKALREVHTMQFSRRHFIGAIAAGSAGIIVPRAKAVRVQAVVRTGNQPILLPRAMAALNDHGSKIANRDVIGIVDFSSPSHIARLHLVDICNGRVIAEHLVAHGHGSDPDNSGWVERFSNRPGSNASSNGSFLTSDTYAGKHGRSRRLIGLDPENSLAFDRGIVVHAASYVDNAMALTQGRIGRSQGCFAVSKDEIGEVLSRLGPGCLLFAGK